MPSAGQAWDGHAAEQMLTVLPEGCRLLADRALLAVQEAEAVIPSMPQPGPVIPHDREACKARKMVERFFDKLKHSRAVATRYVKRDDNYLAAVQPAYIRIWLRSYEPVT